MTGPPLTVAVDVGGTNLRLALIEGEDHLLERLEVPTPESCADIPDVVVAGASGMDARAVGIGVAGLVRHDEGVVAWMPHRPGTEVAVGARVAEALGVPVVVDNDANMACLAEARLGSGVGHRAVLLITVGTGIGASLALGGSVERGRDHLGEVGHVVLDPGGPECRCGLRGCWEAMASGTALDRAARLLAAADPRGALAAACAGRTPSGVDLVVAARAGDGDAAAAVYEVGSWLGRGLGAMIGVFDPDVLVVGGSVGLLDEVLDPAREVMMGYIPGAAHRRPTPVERGALGGDAGLIGAALTAGGAT